MNSLLRAGRSQCHRARGGGLLAASTVIVLSMFLAPAANAQFTYCLIQGPAVAECGTQTTFVATSPSLPTSSFNATWSLINNTAGASFVGGNTCTNVLTCPVVVTTSNTGSVGVRVVLTFAGGFQRTCQVTLTVIDTTPPIITCPPDIVVPCQTSIDPSVTGTPIVSDCSPFTVIHSDQTTGSNCAGPIISRTWTAMDSNGLIASCVQTISFVSMTSITCPGPVSVQCLSNVPPPDIGSVTASDSCGGPVTVTHVGDAASNGVSSCNNVITRTYRAVNACGVEATCTQTITVNDTTAPTIQCPGPVNVQCFALVPLPSIGSVVTSDNCGGTVTVAHVGDVASNGTSNCNNTITRTYRATDACGNQSTCTQIITVNDSTPPSIQCPGPVSVQCFAQVPAPSTGAVIASDNCGGMVVVMHVSDVASNGASDCNNTITRTYSATDGCGNQATCTQIITVNDTTPPSIQCPGPVSVQCFALVPQPSTTAVIASDNCGGAVVVMHVSDVPSNGTSNCNNTITRTYSATDACGNQATCTQFITVNDTTLPTITCPGPVSVQCFSLVPQPDINSVTAADNCGEAVTVTHDGDVASNGTSSCNNVITRTYRATDSCGNQATCTQTILVNDTTLPTITCPDPISVQCFSNVPAPSTTAVVASDNCGDPVIVTHDGDVATNGTSSCNNVITRTYRVEDACGNEATCTQIITVNDTTPPVITCPPIFGAICGTSIDPMATGFATATDNCDPAPIIGYTDVTTGGCPTMTETITRTWTATDLCNNVATCDQIITLTGGGGSITGCVIDLYGGCGSPTVPHLSALLTTPPPTLTFSIQSAAPNAPGLLAAQLPPYGREIPLSTDCILHIDPASPTTIIAGSLVTDPAGAWSVSLTPIPAVFDVRLQAAILSIGQPLGLYQLTNAIQVARPGPCPPCTYARDEWAAIAGPSSSLYDQHWLTVFPSGMDIGLFNGGAPGFGNHWTGDLVGRSNLKTFLQYTGGASSPLTADAVNPTTTTAGGFARLVAVLQLNISFNAAGFLGAAIPGFASMTYVNPGDALDGFTVQQILDVSNQVLAGVVPPPVGYTIESLSGLLEELSRAYDGCNPSGWATTHLSLPPA